MQAAVLGLVRAAAKELGARGVTCNAVCPGLFRTEMVTREVGEPKMAAYARSFPVPRLGQPKEVGDLVRFLASKEAGYITGASLDINGGDLML